MNNHIVRARPLPPLQTPATLTRRPVFSQSSSLVLSFCLHARPRVLGWGGASSSPPLPGSTDGMAVTSLAAPRNGREVFPKLFWAMCSTCKIIQTTLGFRLHLPP